MMKIKKTKEEIQDLNINYYVPVSMRNPSREARKLQKKKDRELHDARRILGIGPHMLALLARL